MENEIKMIQLEVTPDELRELQIAVRVGLKKMKAIQTQKDGLRQSLKLLRFIGEMAPSPDKDKQTKIAEEATAKLFEAIDKEYKRTILLTSVLDHIKVMADVEGVELYPESEGFATKEFEDIHKKLCDDITKDKDIK